MREATISAGPLAVPEASRAAAKEAGLRYVNDRQPGIVREKSGKGFVFRREDGGRIADEAALARIRHLAIPPAWTEVWICPEANGHIQATGRDARGRKQYRYHADWRAARDETKYGRMIAFGKALPKIRRQVSRDLRQRGLGREKVLAAMVRLLETTLIRVGNEEYAQQNRSFGLSTMRDRHVSIARGTIHFEFRGKSGRKHEIDLHDPKLAKIVRGSQDLPGQELFQYLDEKGAPQKISSEDVNDYLRRVAGEEFSAKDFRTWAGTVLAAVALREFERAASLRQAKQNVVEAIARVAAKLGNTPAVCRKCYVHPVVMESYLNGETVDILRQRADQMARDSRSTLRPEEAAVLAFLGRKLKQARIPTTELLRRSLRRNQRGKALRRGRRVAQRRPVPTRTLRGRGSPERAGVDSSPFRKR